MPGALYGGFVALTLGLYGLLCWLAWHRRVSALKTPVIFAGLWLGFTAWLAATGKLSNFSKLPPRIPILAATQFVALGWIIFGSRRRDELSRLPQSLLIGLQLFRLPVELLLGALAGQGLLPREMSFHGNNFDMITALTAPFMAWAATGLEPWRVRGLIFVWNAMGIILVTSVVVRGMLSVPYPFQVLHLSRNNTIIATFPAIWLVTFLVPLAYALHFVSIRKALRRRVRPLQQSRPLVSSATHSQ